MPQATKHFQWAFHDSSLFDAITRSRKGLLLNSALLFRCSGGLRALRSSVVQSQCKTARARTRRETACRVLSCILYPLSTWSPLAVNMDQAIAGSAPTPDSILQSGEEAKCRSTRVSRALGRRPAHAEKGTRFADGWRTDGVENGFRLLEKGAKGAEKAGEAPTVELPSRSRFRSRTWTG